MQTAEGSVPSDHLLSSGDTIAAPQPVKPQPQPKPKPQSSSAPVKLVTSIPVDRRRVLADDYQEALRSGSAATKSFLHVHPEIIGNTLGRNFAIVFTRYSAGANLAFDFVVVTAPQWYELYQVILVDPKTIPFDATGSPTPALQAALTQAQLSRKRWLDARSTISRDLAEGVRQIEEQFVTVYGEDIRSGDWYRSPEYLAGSLEGLSIASDRTIIVIGRRDSYRRLQEQGRAALRQANPDIEIVSFDALASVLRDTDD
jgi:hypothetical protein